MFRAIRANRIARWAAIAIALNLVALTGPFFGQLRSRKSLDLWVPAADVHPYLNPDTREVVEYKVSDVSVTEVVSRAQWPKFEELYGALGLNVVLFAWMLRLALIESRERAHNLQHERGGGEPPLGSPSPGKMGTDP